EISWASSRSSSVVSPIAERTPTTRLPSSCVRTSRRATALIRSGPATLVPPNFITTVPACGARSSLATPGTDWYAVPVIEPFCLGHLAASRQRAAEGHLVGVLEVAADREAAREAGHANPAAEAVGEERSRGLAGHVRVRREHD